MWNKVKGLGTEEDSMMNSIIMLMNQMVFIGAFICFLMVGVAIYSGLAPVYTLLTFVFGCILLSLLVLNSFNKFHTSKFVIVSVLPIYVCLEILLIGGSFGEESILTIILLLIYIFFEDSPKKRYPLYASLSCSYILVSVYLFYFPPILPPVDNPYDNFFAFLVCTIWLLSIMSYYQKKIESQQKKQDILIKELQEKNTNLEKTTEALEQFTYIASHDLKSPLRTIISFLDLIKRDVSRKKYEDISSKLDFARSGAEQMNFLVTDILEYSKITSGKARRKNMISLQSVADKVKFNLMDQIKEKNVDLYIFPLPDFYCNETEMTVLFQNLIENGIKYNEESTPNIFIKSKVEGKELILQFIDNGIGIEEIYFEKIFLFFKRLHTNQIYKGTGLGLGLCKKIIDDMNGSIMVESTINVGSTFTVRLPILVPEGYSSITTIPVEQNN